MDVENKCNKYKYRIEFSLKKYSFIQNVSSAQYWILCIIEDLIISRCTVWYSRTLQWLVYSTSLSISCVVTKEWSYNRPRAGEGYFLNLILLLADN